MLPGCLAPWRRGTLSLEALAVLRLAPVLQQDALLPQDIRAFRELPSLWLPMLFVAANLWCPSLIRRFLQHLPLTSKE